MRWWRCFPQNITVPALHVAATGDTTDEFERASEHGEPAGHSRRSPVIDYGATFDYWDKAARYTRKYISNATVAEVGPSMPRSWSYDN